MATDAIKTRVLAFDEHLLTRLNDDHYQIDMPNHVFYLHDDDYIDAAGVAGNIPLDAEYGDMIQPLKLDADDIVHETFDQYIGAEILVDSNGE
jgi:hypothetical protein